MREDLPKCLANAAGLTLSTEPRESVHFFRIRDFRQRVGPRGRNGQEDQFVAYANQLHLLPAQQRGSPKGFYNLF